MLHRFTGLFHQTRKSNSSTDKPFQLGSSQEEDIKMLMELFPLMEKNMGVSLDDLEQAHNEQNNGSPFNQHFTIALERAKAAKESEGK